MSHPTHGRQPHHLGLAGRRDAAHHRLAGNRRAAVAQRAAHRVRAVRARRLRLGGDALRRQTEGSPIRGKVGTNWDKAVMGQMPTNPQLVDVIYPRSEGWESPELAPSLHYAC